MKPKVSDSTHLTYDCADALQLSVGLVGVRAHRLTKRSIKALADNIGPVFGAEGCPAKIYFEDAGQTASRHKRFSLVCIYPKATITFHVYAALERAALLLMGSNQTEMRAAADIASKWLFPNSRPQVCHYPH